MSRKKLLAIGLISVLAIKTFAGCEKKDVDYNMDHNQGQNSSDQGSALAEGDLAGRLGIPDSCDISIDVGESGLHSITIVDDAIEVPDTDHMSIIHYTELELGNDYKREIAESLFDKEEGIYVYDYARRTKRDVEDDMEYRQIWLQCAQANGDTASAQGFAEELISLEAEYETAEDWYEPAGDFSGDIFIGTRDGREFRMGVYSEGNSVVNVSFSMNDREDIEYRPYEGEYDGPTRVGVARNIGPSVDELIGTNVAELTTREAVIAAESFLYDLGLPDVTQTDIQTLEWIYYEDGYGSYTQNLETVYDGYVVNFVRAIDDIPRYDERINSMLVTNIAEQDVYLEIPAERYSVYVDDNGVLGAKWNTIYASGGETEETVDLLSWDEIIEKANNNMAEYYTQYPDDHSDIIFNDVRLTYFPVADEEKENGYQYIPVWVFVKHWEFDDGLRKLEDPQFLVVMNAMDGSIIDMVEQAKAFGVYRQNQVISN